MLLSDAKLVLKEFEKQLNGYKIESFIINQNEKVIVIEDALVLYLATINHYEYWLQEKAKTSRNYNPHDVGLYIVELTYNTIRNKDDLWQIKWNILENAKKGFYDNIERNTYIRPSNRWKTEELIYKYIKKIYKNYKVIYQHRPFFLVGPSGGQMSYDIFITGLNIAIEYQGRQHFEPVDFFGGQESFEKTIVRDKLKKELSEKNNIKLIYINYWENVSLSFIKEKIEKILSELELQNPQL